MRALGSAHARRGCRGWPRLLLSLLLHPLSIATTVCRVTHERAADRGLWRRCRRRSLLLGVADQSPPLPLRRKADGKTPLHLAAAAGHAEEATFLLQKGAWAEAYDAEDCTPLHLAARNGHVAAVEALLKHGAKHSAANKQGLTPLAEALLAGQVAAARALLGWGAQAADCRPRGFSLLHLAAGLGQAESAALLLELGADVAGEGG